MRLEGLEPSDRAHVQALHRYMFQDVYPWAGEFRTVEIGFAFSPNIVSSLDRRAAELREENHLAGLDVDQFARRGA